jgi:hypothetical protein
LGRWNKVTSIKVDTPITGTIWYVKGRVDVLKDVVINAETKRERLTMEFLDQDKRTFFEPDRVVVQTSENNSVRVSSSSPRACLRPDSLSSAQGETLTARDNPKKSFEGQTLETPWDDLQVAYFSGEAMWSYLNIPFLEEQPGFEAEEITPIQVDGESWRRLKVSLPENVRGHTRRKFPASAQMCF